MLYDLSLCTQRRTVFLLPIFLPEAGTIEEVSPFYVFILTTVHGARVRCTIDWSEAGSTGSNTLPDAPTRIDQLTNVEDLFRVIVIVAVLPSGYRNMEINHFLFFPLCAHSRSPQPVHLLSSDHSLRFPVILLDEHALSKLYLLFIII